MLRGLLQTMVLIWREPQGRGILIALGAVFGVGTVFYRLAEDWSWIDSFYFTVVTLTTVGYGDLAPTTALSKLFTVFLILVGVGFILGFLDFLVRQTFARRARD